MVTGCLGLLFTSVASGLQHYNHAAVLIFFSGDCFYLALVPCALVNFPSSLVVRMRSCDKLLTRRVQHGTPLEGYECGACLSMCLDLEKTEAGLGGEGAEEEGLL